MTMDYHIFQNTNYDDDSVTGYRNIHMNTIFRQNAGHSWNDYSDLDIQGGSACVFRQRCFDSSADASNELSQDDFDPTDICIIAGSEKDNTLSRGDEDLLRKMWALARPPQRMSIKKPVVTARQLDLIRAQLTGELPKKLQTNLVCTDEETSAKIVSVIKDKKERRNRRCSLP